MKAQEKIHQLINLGWLSFKNKVASGLFNPENEKMMQLQLAQTFQMLTSIYEYTPNESIKVLLEVPVNIQRQPSRRIIDIVIQHSSDLQVQYFPIELKCFRRLTRDGLGKRGAQNLGMYDYWMDIENIEQYTLLKNYSFGTHLALTDDSYYVIGSHRGERTSVYSTNNTKAKVSGLLEQPIANRPGSIKLLKNYSMTGWEKIGEFYFIRQEYTETL